MNPKRPSERFSDDAKARNQFLHDVGVCCVSGASHDIEVAHISGPDHLFNKVEAGMAAKSHWVWTVPLTRTQHRKQHSGSERNFWDGNGYPWRSLTEGPMATALILEGFRSLDDVTGAQRWLIARSEMFK